MIQPQQSIGLCSKRQRTWNDYWKAPHRTVLCLHEYQSNLKEKRPSLNSVRPHTDESHWSGLLGSETRRNNRYRAWNRACHSRLEELKLESCGIGRSSSTTPFTTRSQQPAQSESESQIEAESESSKRHPPGLASFQLCDNLNSSSSCVFPTDIIPTSSARLLH